MIRKLLKRLKRKPVEPADRKIATQARKLRKWRKGLDPRQAWRDIADVRARDLEKRRALLESELAELKLRISDKERREKIRRVK